MAMIKVNKNSGYRWFKSDQICFKGYLISVEDGKIFKDNSAIFELKKIKNFDDFCQFLKTIDGNFATIIEKEDHIWAAVDIARSIPIFYSIDGEYVSDSAEDIRMQLKIPAENVDADNYLELVANDYLFGNKTVYSQILQLDLGQAVQINKRTGEIKTLYYFQHLVPEILSFDIDKIKSMLTDVSIRTFQRLKDVIGNRPVALSMSGGYDSRFVGCMLKKVGVEDVSCYTYGKSDSFEVKQSKKNAEALGYRWICVEHTDEETYRALDETGVRYIDSYDGHDFTAYMQNFPSVRKLHEDGWFKPGTVFLTGLCGDMPTGNYIELYDPQKKYNVSTAVERVYNLIFTRYKMPESFKEKWIADIEKTISNLPIKITNYESWSKVVDCIYTGTCHVHWFMHMNTVHSFFFFFWLLPYWSIELLKVWYSIPAEMKRGQALYEDWLLNDICAEYGLGTKKYRATYSRSPFLRKIIYKVGSFISFVYLNIGIPFKRKYDYNNFAPFELRLFKNLKCKTTVSYKKAGMVHLVNQYCLQKRYGVANMKKAIKKIK